MKLGRGCLRSLTGEVVLMALMVGGCQWRLTDRGCINRDWQRVVLISFSRGRLS
jgi:hypothetical protein